MPDRWLIETFERDGAVAVRGLLAGERVRSLRDATPQILEKTCDPSERMNGEPTGAMKFVAGSHVDPDEVVNNGAIGVSESELDQRCMLTFGADPGHVVLFHPRALHSAYGSAPDRPRRTFTLRFVGDDVRWRPRRSMYHAWMRACGLQKGDTLDHPWFPVVGRSQPAGLTSPGQRSA